MRGSSAAVVLLVGLGLFAGCAPRAAKPQPPETSQPEAPRAPSGPRVTKRDTMPRGYLGEGLASFYGPGLHGRPTASGERSYRYQCATSPLSTTQLGPDGSREPPRGWSCTMPSNLT